MIDILPSPLFSKDSVYSIKAYDIFKDMAEDEEFFDFSGYPTNHPYFSSKNKKVIGKMKDELNGGLMKEFIGLRAKTYIV